MAFIFKFESIFKDDYKREMRSHPELKGEFEEAARELAANGRLPEEYSPHELGKAGGNYNGHIDFHLSNGDVDVIVLYLPHKTNPIIRFVRMGPHDLLFSGPRK